MTRAQSLKATPTGSLFPPDIVITDDTTPNLWSTLDDVESDVSAPTPPGACIVSTNSPDDHVAAESFDTVPVDDTSHKCQVIKKPSTMQRSFILVPVSGCLHDPGGLAHDLLARSDPHARRHGRTAMGATAMAAPSSPWPGPPWVQAQGIYQS